MPDVDAALAANRDAVDEMLRAAEAAAGNWTTPRAPGKWSPQQVVEHVARAMEEAASMIEGGPTKFPSVPGFVRPLVRVAFFNPTVRKGKFPKAKTNRAMDPSSGPETPAGARSRLETALAKFDKACRGRAAVDGYLTSTVFGRVPVVDYARFNELHTRHHTKQIPAG